MIFRRDKVEIYRDNDVIMVRVGRNVAIKSSRLTFRFQALHENIMIIHIHDGKTDIEITTEIKNLVVNHTGLNIGAFSVEYVTLVIDHDADFTQ